MGCRATDDKRELVRVVRAEAIFVLDPRGDASGRGAYLHPACAPRALRTRAVQRALRVPARDDAALAALLGALGDGEPAWANPDVAP